MKPESKVLACVDQSHFADHVADYAVWAARRMEAPLEFLHILDRHPETALSGDRSGQIGIDAEQHLLEALSGEDEARSRTAREQGRLFLDGLRERARTGGIEAPDVRQRNGELVETLVEQEADVRLFVLGRRGEAAEASQRDLGRNVERVVRALRKPILAVTDDFRQPQRVLIAFDGSPATRRGVEFVAAERLFSGLAVQVLLSGRATRDAEKQLAWAVTTLEAAGVDAGGVVQFGDAEAVILSALREQAIDLLVMGAYAHSALRSLVLGSKTSGLLRAAPVPTLLVR